MRTKGNADDTERVTIASLAEAILADGQAKTKAEANAKARLEVANLKAQEAAAKVKAIEAAQKRLEREQAKKERFAQNQKERKERTRRLIQVGGLIEKAGLLNWDEATLLGGLFALASQREDTKFMEQFKKSGLAAFKAEAKATPAADSDQPGTGKILVRFPGGKPAPEVLAALKATGKWSWNKEALRWEGEADPEAVRAAVAPVAVEIESL